MEEVEFEYNGSLNGSEMVYLENLMNISKRHGVQTGITWNSDVYSYLFENRQSFKDLSLILGADLIFEEA